MIGAALSDTAPKKIGIIGLGLIGGGIAHRIRAVYPACHIAVTSSRQTLDKPEAKALYDTGVTHLIDMPTDCEIVFICTPIYTINRLLNQCFHHFDDTTILTDVGSLKASIINQAPDVSPQVFIGGHPMAGKEVSGVEHADADLLKRCRYVLIPVKDPRYVPFKKFIASLDVDVIEMTADRHDELVGLSSHFPYVASVLAVSMARSVTSQEDMAALKSVLSSGFRDTTRVSGSNPDWGADVLLENRTLLTRIRQAKAILSQLEKMIQNQDRTEITRFLSEIQALKKTLDT